MVNFTGALFRRSPAAAPVSLALPAWGHADSPWKVDGKVLAGGAANRHSSIRPSNPGGRCSQGGVKVPTGGKGQLAQARERLRPLKSSLEVFLEKRVSRFGVIPKPTVKVRMKENGRDSRYSARRVVPYALILVLKEESHESDVARTRQRPSPRSSTRISRRNSLNRNQRARRDRSSAGAGVSEVRQAAARRLRAV